MLLLVVSSRRQHSLMTHPRQHQRQPQLQLPVQMRIRQCRECCCFESQSRSSAHAGVELAASPAQCLARPLPERAPQPCQQPLSCCCRPPCQRTARGWKHNGCEACEHPTVWQLRTWLCSECPVGSVSVNLSGAVRVCKRTLLQLCSLSPCWPHRAGPCERAW